MPDNRTYRIKANVQGEDYVDIDVNLNQDISAFEFLSLKIDTENLYRLHTAGYGCVVGRVLANNAMGVPNVKISIFIEADSATDEDAVLHYLYPYKNVTDKNTEGIRYNLLPEEQLFLCHQNVGTFPSKRLVLDDNNVFEVFDKYYKFTTTTNSAGDYMIFGVPVGTQILHMDVDLSDIGDLLSQKPKDFIYKGYNVNQFENANMFKKDKNLGSLTQIFSQNESVNVHPFWGETEEMGEADSTGVRITRKDINLNYKFEPTCVFMGSLITDEKSNGFTKRCVPTERMGKMDRITTGEGTIEMIRKTPDGRVESYNIMGNQLIDGNGTWCYQIPMNLDYVRTDEYGNIVPTNDIERGLPTRAQVRFRVSLNDFASDYENNHLSKMLVPNNPQNQTELSEAYAFGSKTPDSEFRDLFWNKVYSVKSYIPRLQKSNTNREKRFSGIKAVNVNVGNNPIPYNNMRIDITFMFVLQCAIMHMLIWMAGVLNALISAIYGFNIGTSYRDNMEETIAKFKGCVTVGDGACPDLDGWYFAPRCKNDNLIFGNPLSNTLDRVKEREGVSESKSAESLKRTDAADSKSSEYENADDSQICLTNKIDYFIQCIEMALAQEYEVIQFDFYNDWINGLLYIPRWFANIKKKRKYLFGLFGPQQIKTQACIENIVNYRRRYVQQCALTYKKSNNGKYTDVITEKGCVKKTNNKNNEYPQKCHKAKGRKNVRIKGGFVHDEQTMLGQYVYYFKPCGFDTGKKINYFATDIILLGSLSIHDMDGVPQSFKELTSSSYQMPTNIAATNMDTVAYMYGTASSGGSLCSGKSIQDVKRQENTFTDYEKWAKTSDYGDDIENDPTEYEVTEAAGIDWGYTGPGQKYVIQPAIKGGGKNGKDKEEVAANYDNSFYQPGGHFLGIACFNAESNIKSCVNLSRVCEFGATFSQRKALVRRVNDRPVTDKDFIVPTGLISKDEISDSGFRSEFATLNHNGLATRINPSTNRVEYDFISMLPNNFEGALKSRISGITPYNNLKGTKEPAGSHPYSATAYTRTIEDASVDYYDFRLGVNNKNWKDNKSKIEDKYLIIDSSGAALPMYNNSYYFYFGLKDGSTALDRFYKEFFAPCPELNEGAAFIRITTENIPDCGNSTAGSAKIYLSGIDTVSNRVEYFLYKDGVSVPNKNGAYPAGSSFIEITGLAVGSYEIKFTSDIFDDIIKSFVIVQDTPSFISDVTIEVEDFKVEKYDTTSQSSSDEGGSVKVSWPNDLNNIILGWKVSNKSGNRYVPSNGSLLLNGDTARLWTDEEYIIKIRYKCSNGAIKDDVEIYRFTPFMPKDFDVSIGGSTTVTYNRTIKDKNLGNNWWEGILNSNGKDIEKFYVEKAIAFRWSMANRETGSIDVSPINGTTPYDIDVVGSGEALEDSGGNNLPILHIANTDTEGYNVDYENFLCPTRNIPTGNIGYVIAPKTKNNYAVRFTDKNGNGAAIPSEEGRLLLPSIYKPFFFRCAIKRNMTLVDMPTSSIRYSLAIVNGSLYRGMYGGIKVCGKAYEDLSHNQGSWWALTDGDVNSFKVKKCNGELTSKETMVAGSKYSVYIKEGEPLERFALESTGVYSPKEVTETVNFLGDGNTPDPRVRYFLIYRSTPSGGRKVGNKSYITAIKKIFDNICFSDEEHLKEGQDGENIYWSGSCTKAFDCDADADNTNPNDKGRFIFNPKNELDHKKIFAGDATVISAEDRKLDCFVMGVFDPWTMLSDEDFAASQYPGRKWLYAKKDADMLAVFRLYTAQQFVEIIENPGLYIDEQIIEDSGEANKAFMVKTDSLYKELLVEPNEDGHIENKIFEEDTVIGTFVINNLQQEIYVPSFKVKVNAPANALYSSAKVTVKISINGNDIYFPEECSISADNNPVPAINGYKEFSTIADDLLARNIGTGTYKVKVHTYIEIVPKPTTVWQSAGCTVAIDSVQLRVTQGKE